MNYIPTDGNNERTGLAELTSWDPRLARVDSFLSTKDNDGTNPVIVPFASTTAAGAFYDMVFTTEVLTDVIMRKMTTKNGKSIDELNDYEARADNIDYNMDYNSNE